MSGETALDRAPEGERRTVRWLVCRAGAGLCALPLDSIGEIMRVLPVEPVAAPACVRGLSVIRGEPVPVVDLALLLGETSRDPARLVTVKLGRRRVALAVEAVLGLRSLDPGQLGALPPLLQDRASGAIEAVGTLDAELLFLLQAAKLLPDELFDHLPAGDAG